MTSMPVVAPATLSLDALLFSYWAGQEQLRALLDPEIDRYRAARGT